MVYYQASLMLNTPVIIYRNTVANLNTEKRICVHKALTDLLYDAGGNVIARKVQV